MTNTWETTVRTAANTMLRFPEKLSAGLEAELYALLEQLDTTNAEQPESTGTPDDARMTPSENNTSATGRNPAAGQGMRM